MDISGNTAFWSAILGLIENTPIAILNIASLLFILWAIFFA